MVTREAPLVALAVLAVIAPFVLRRYRHSLKSLAVTEKPAPSPPPLSVVDAINSRFRHGDNAHPSHVRDAGVHRGRARRLRGSLDAEAREGDGRRGASERTRDAARARRARA